MNCIPSYLRPVGGPCLRNRDSVVVSATTQSVAWRAICLITSAVGFFTLIGGFDTFLRFADLLVFIPDDVVWEFRYVAYVIDMILPIFIIFIIF